MTPEELFDKIRGLEFERDQLKRDYRELNKAVGRLEGWKIQMEEEAGMRKPASPRPARANESPH